MCSFPMVFQGCLSWEAVGNPGAVSGSREKPGSNCPRIWGNPGAVMPGRDRLGVHRGTSASIPCSRACPSGAALQWVNLCRSMPGARQSPQPACWVPAEPGEEAPGPNASGTRAEAFRRGALLVMGSRKDGKPGMLPGPARSPPHPSMTAPPNPSPSGWAQGLSWPRLGSHREAGHPECSCGWRKGAFAPGEGAGSQSSARWCGERAASPCTPPSLPSTDPSFAPAPAPGPEEMAAGRGPQLFSPLGLLLSI